MTREQKQRQIAYRCPECGVATIGIMGKFALEASMIRLKCSCEKSSALDVTVTNDKKAKLSVPCILCKENHSYTVSESILFERDKFALSCPYAGNDIAIIGDEETVVKELERTHAELDVLMQSLQADEIAELQPCDMSDEEILPDPAVYDTLRFVVKDLEAEGRVKCPCKKGEGYELRFAEGGIDVYCPHCGASRFLHAASPALTEEYLSLEELILK